MAQHSGGNLPLYPPPPRQPCPHRRVRHARGPDRFREEANRGLQQHLNGDPARIRGRSHGRPDSLASSSVSEDDGLGTEARYKALWKKEERLRKAAEKESEQKERQSHAFLQFFEDYILAKKRRESDGVEAESESVSESEVESDLGEEPQSRSSSRARHRERSRERFRERPFEERAPPYPTNNNSRAGQPFMRGAQPANGYGRGCPPIPPRYNGLRAPPPPPENIINDLPQYESNPRPNFNGNFHSEPLFNRWNKPRPPQSHRMHPTPNGNDRVLPLNIDKEVIELRRQPPSPHTQRKLAEKDALGQLPPGALIATDAPNIYIDRDTRERMVVVPAGPGKWHAEPLVRGNEVRIRTARGDAVYASGPVDGGPLVVINNWDRGTRDSRREKRRYYE